MTTPQPSGETYRDPDGNVITRDEWTALVIADASVVAVDEPIPGVKVCTYWIGIGTSNLMSIIDGGVLDYEQVGSGSKAEALAVHAELVDRVKHLRTVWMGRELTVTMDGPYLHLAHHTMRARIEIAELATLIPALHSVQPADDAMVMVAKNLNLPADAIRAISHLAEKLAEKQRVAVVDLPDAAREDDGGVIFEAVTSTGPVEVGAYPEGAPLDPAATVKVFGRWGTYDDAITVAANIIAAAELVGVRRG